MMVLEENKGKEQFQLVIALMQQRIQGILSDQKRANFDSRTAQSSERAGVIDLSLDNSVAGRLPARQRSTIGQL